MDPRTYAERMIQLVPEEEEEDGWWKNDFNEVTPTFNSW